MICCEPQTEEKLSTERMSSQPKNAVVIGAGVVGVCTAFELSKSGYNVTVIEKFPLAAQFCSMGNAGVVRDHKEPSDWKSIKSKYKGPSLVTEAIKSLWPTFKPNYSSHAFIDPYFFTDITSYKWLYSFAKSKFTNKDQEVIDSYDKFCFNAFISNAIDIQNMTGNDFLCNKGYASIFPPLSAISLINPQNIYNDLMKIKSKQLDIPQSRPQRQDVDGVKLEMFPDAFASDCHAFTNTVARFKQIDFRFNTEAKQILVDGNHNVCGVEIDDDSMIKADKIVICCGVLTNNIIQNKVYQINGKLDNRKKMKLPYIPVVPLQGFSISVPYSPKDKYKFSFGTLVYYPSNMYVSRINDNLLRFTNYGYFRPTRYATKLWNDMQNITSSKEGIQTNVINPTKFERELLDNLDGNVKDNVLSLYDIDEKYWNKNKIEWRGLRPYTPDGLPIVDKINNVNGLYINCGHGTLGWGTSHGTAKLITSLINNNSDKFEEKILKILSLDRF